MSKPSTMLEVVFELHVLAAQGEVNLRGMTALDASIVMGLVEWKLQKRGGIHSMADMIVQRISTENYFKSLNL